MRALRRVGLLPVVRHRVSAPQDGFGATRRNVRARACRRRERRPRFRWSATSASIEVLADPDPQTGNTLTNSDAVVPSRGTLRGSGGLFTYQVPANSLTVIRVTR